MKATTTQIYNLITSGNFENIKHKLAKKIEEHNWQIPERQEYTYDELLNDLPDNIDFIKQNIEDGNFDKLPFATRQQINQTISQINTYLTNIYANNQQFANLQDLTQSLASIVRANRLDFEARKIPRYKEKIKEYKELIEELNDLNTILKTTKIQKNELEAVLNRAKEVLSDIDNNADKAKQSEEGIKLKLENSTETYNQINALLATIQEHRDTTAGILQESKEAKNNVKEGESEIKSFFNQIDEYKTKIESFIEDTQEKILGFASDTETIIETNKTQKEEIDRQLQKAVGASLFSTFAKRKGQLAPASWGWLVVIVLSIIGMSYISYDIINDFTKSVDHIDMAKNIGKSVFDANKTNALINNVDNLNSHVSWMWIFLKMTLLFPLIYLISFATSRYGKERRLIEEYAFKSTISLALTPYADLIKKIENEGADSKYRDFLISSIENIFSVPTDKAFGYNKHSQRKENTDEMKTIEDIISLISKAKNIGKIE